MLEKILKKLGLKSNTAEKLIDGVRNPVKRAMLYHNRGLTKKGQAIIDKALQYPEKEKEHISGQCRYLDFVESAESEGFVINKEYIKQIFERLHPDAFKLDGGIDKRFSNFVESDVLREKVEEVYKEAIDEFAKFYRYGSETYYLDRLEESFNLPENLMYNEKLRAFKKILHESPDSIFGVTGYSMEVTSDATDLISRLGIKIEDAYKTIEEFVSKVNTEEIFGDRPKTLEYVLRIVNKFEKDLNLTDEEKKELSRKYLERNEYPNLSVIEKHLPEEVKAILERQKIKDDRSRFESALSNGEFEHAYELAEKYGYEEKESLKKLI